MKMNKQQKEEMIEEMSAYYKRRANFYEAVLKFGKVETDKMLELISIYDVVGMTGVYIYNDDNITKEIALEQKQMCIKAMKHVDDELKEIRNLFNKALYLAELESDEIKKLIIGYYMAICATILTPYLTLKNS